MSNAVVTIQKGYRLLFTSASTFFSPRFLIIPGFRCSSKSRSLLLNQLSWLGLYFRSLSSYMADFLFCITLLALLSRYRVFGPARFGNSRDLCMQDKRIRYLFKAFFTKCSILSENTVVQEKWYSSCRNFSYPVSTHSAKNSWTHDPQFMAHEKMAFTFRHRLSTYMDVNRHLQRHSRRFKAPLVKLSCLPLYEQRIAFPSKSICTWSLFYFRRTFT